MSDSVLVKSAVDPEPSTSLSVAVGDSCPSALARIPSLSVAPSSVAVGSIGDSAKASSPAPEADPAAGVILTDLNKIVTDITTDSTLGDKLFQLILDAAQKKPESAKEAVELTELVFQKEIQPLIKKLQDWAVEGLKKDDVATARKAWDEIKIFEKNVSGWCCVPKVKAKAK